MIPWDQEANHACPNNWYWVQTFACRSKLANAEATALIKDFSPDILYFSQSVSLFTGTQFSVRTLHAISEQHKTQDGLIVEILLQLQMDSSNFISKPQHRLTPQQSSERPEDKLYYLHSDFSVWLRTNKEEIETPLPGQITFCQIPSWLSGSLVRNGPGGIDAYEPGVCRHVFDAPGRLHKYQIHDGEVLYTSKFIQSRAFKRNTAAKRLVFNEFGTFATRDPCQTIFSSMSFYCTIRRVAAMFSHSIDSIFSDNANISIFPFGDEIYSLAETPFAHRINLDNLETINTVNVHDELGIVHHTSHPHTLDGKVYNIGQKLSLLKRPKYIIVEMDCIDDGSGSEFRKDNNDPIPKDILKTQSKETALLQDGSKQTQSTILSPWATTKIVATVPSRWPLSMGYIHSFAVTTNYFILIEQPLSIFLPDVPLNLLRREPVASALKFYSNKKTLFHVIRRNQQGFNRSSKSRQVFSVPSFFFFHTINGFETVDGDTSDISIVVDICCYDDPSIINCMYVDALKNAHTNPDYAKMLRGRPKRFTMKLSKFENSQRGASQVAQSKLIVDIGCETPRINYESFNGKPYNYFYALSSDVDANQPAMLIKVDVLKETFITWMEPNAYPSEPIFVPSPDSKAEDDGLILSTLLYGGESVTGPSRATLLILKAQTWEPMTKVDIYCETSIPKCLHGWFFPDLKTTSFSTSKQNGNDDLDATKATN